MTAYCLGYQKNSDIKKLSNEMYISITLNFCTIYLFSTRVHLDYRRFLPRVWQMGLLLNLAETFVPVTNRCRVDTPPKGKTSTLKLTDFVGAFALLSIGFGLSITCFTMEFFFWTTLN